MKVQAYNIEDHPLPKDRSILVRLESYNEGMRWFEVEWIEELNEFDVTTDTAWLVSIDTATHWCELPEIGEE